MKFRNNKIVMVIKGNSEDRNDDSKPDFPKKSFLSNFRPRKCILRNEEMKKGERKTERYS